MIIDNKFEIGDEVYLKTDVDQKLRLLTSIQILPVYFLYRLSCGTTDSWHHDIEITLEKSYILETEKEAE